MAGDPALHDFPGELVRREDVRGDLHCHTTYSDGLDRLRDMAEAAISMKHRYLAITDHGFTGHVRSLSEDTLGAQREEINALNAELGDRLSILQGTELDIGPDGELSDLGGMVYELDLVIASIHSHFDLARPQMTARVQTALSHPFVSILGHPTARRSGTRPPVDMDLEAVFETASDNRVALEINSTPTRLDLRDDHIRLARKYDCRFAIDTDSHSAKALPRISLGVELAQKAGLSPGEIINCLELEGLRSFLTRR